jgi:hypothetical protein
MSKNAIRAKAVKQKQKKRILISVCAVLAMFVLVIVIYSCSRSKQQNTETTEIYSRFGQTVQLYPDGKFIAILAHNVRKSGTYTKTNESGRITVSFYVNNNVEIGWIINNVLHIPREWDDGHGHGNMLPKAN